MRRVAILTGVLLSAIAIAAMVPSFFESFGGTKVHGQASDRPAAAARDKSAVSTLHYLDPVSAVDGAAGGAATVAAASADFNSDGTGDVVSVDAAGGVHIFAGRIETQFPHLKAANSDGRAFSMLNVEATLPIVPDEVFAGDFNADGDRDVLAYRKGDNSLYLLAGNGKGEFASCVREYVNGPITAVDAGEIGRPDGQTDVAVAYVSESKAYVEIFEHPEGAFSHKPEIFPIHEPGSSITIGQLERDPYADVAIGGGETLTVVHGRGQAYPLDILPEADIQRPAAAVRSMKLNFTVSSLIAAGMDGTRNDGLAILGTDGRVRYFKAGVDADQPKARPRAKTPIVAAGFIPAGIEQNEFVASQQTSPHTESEADASGLLMANTDDILSKGRSKVMKEKASALAAERAKLPADKRAAADAIQAEKQVQLRADRRRLFEAGLAGKPIEFASWKMTNIASDSRLAAAPGGPAKLIKARVSSSGVDDLLIADKTSGNILAVGRWQEKGEGISQTAEVTQIETGLRARSVVPMRLNPDGRSDLVVFDEGTVAPSVVMSGPPAVYTVNTADDVGGGNCVNDGQPCGIRRALFWANFVPGSMIAFDIPGSGVHTIHLTSPLPDLHELTVDGTTQPGYAGTPLIEMKGDLMAGGAVDGFRVTRSNTVIRGMAINQMSGSAEGGSVISGSGIVLLTYIGHPIVSNVTIEASFLGTDATGTVALGNDGNGVQIYNADGNLVGGTTAEARNLLSGNGNYSENKRGVGFAITGGNYNRVYGNYVGTDVTGTLRLGNSDGAFVSGGGNQIGSDDPGTGNVISGNGTPPNEFGHCVGAGLGIIQLYDVDTAAPLTNGTTVRGNLVGTNASGTSAVYNCQQGVTSSGNLNTFIGSITPTGRNTVSGNKYDGIWCGFNDSAFFPVSGACYIEGNNIGTNIAGNAAVPNSGENTCVGFCLITDTVYLPTAGIDVAVVGSPGGTTPNGACTGFCNVISGNYGLYLDGGSFEKAGTGLGLIINNYIGTNAAGDSALPNFSGGLAYYGSALIGVTFSDGQGGYIPGGNLISGNNAQGVGMTSIDGGAFFWIKGNTFGLSSDGLSAIPNGIGGTESSTISVHAQAGTSVQIGGTNPFDRNYLTYETSDGTANRGHGISSFANTSSIIDIRGNYIGVDPHGNPAPNSGDGIDAQGTGHTIIGGGGLDDGNIIANNGRSGVFIYSYAGTFSSSDATGVTVRRNVIRNNGALGIDLTNVNNGGGAAIPDGVTPNDCHDIDTGANGLQNFPELFAPIQNPDGTLRIDTILRSAPSRTYTIDYYVNGQADPTTYGEGQTWVGSTTVMTNGNAFVSVSANTTQQLPTTAIITATATDQDGNTSEFSCAAGVCTEGQNFQERISQAPETTCGTVIVVTTTGDENDIDVDNPVQQRDGLCDVDANTPGEQCTLRAAIQEANARPGFDLVNFDIPGGGIQTIVIPNGDPILPSIKETVDINAMSQPGYVNHPVVQLNGTLDAVAQTIPLVGLRVESNDVTIRGLAINRFTQDIAIFKAGGSANNNKIESCYIGLNADGGIEGIGNGTSQVGVSILGQGATATGNQIGTSHNGNTISNNVIGVVIAGASAQNNNVVGNKIGTTADGMTSLPNVQGMEIGSDARGNTIGGELESDANVISGNLTVGIHMGSNASTNTIAGNYIGTAIDGQTRVGNGAQGVVLAGGAHDNTIGGLFVNRNIIGGNNRSEDPGTATEVVIDAGANSNKVVGNFVGIKKDGFFDLGGVTGIQVIGSNNTIGGVPNSPNIFGVRQFSIVIGSAGDDPSTGNKITYNRIGTSADGSVAMGTNIGIFLQSHGEVSSTQISNNLISGNFAGGILLGEGSSTTSIGNNKIGTTMDGNSALPNGVGILMVKAKDSTIAANVISGNTYFGIFMGDDFAPPNPLAEKIYASARARFRSNRSRTTSSDYTSGNIVKSNKIGINTNGDASVPNGINGIQIGENARSNIIGGNRKAGDGNYIAGHTVSASGTGVYLGSIFVDPADERLPRDNKIQGNFIGWGSNFLEIPNRLGIVIKGAAQNIIGADLECQAPDCAEDDYGNYIGNSIGGAGITFEGDGTIDNNVRGNFLGVTNTFVLGGANSIDGIFYTAKNHNTIEDNVIAGNQRDGFRSEGHTAFTLEDNYAGYNQENGITVIADGSERPGAKRSGRRPDGSAFIKVIGNTVGMLKIGDMVQCATNNINGILIDSIDSVLIDKSASGRRSVVSCNGDAGIKIVGDQASGTRVLNTTVGTDEAGNADLGNGGDGIHIEGASDNTIGGVGSGNIVAGNTGNGISIENANNTTLLGNNVGVVPLKTSVKLPNQKNGVAIKNGTNSFLGGIAPSVTNIISGNMQNGVLITGVNSAANKIIKNVLGTDLSNATGIGNDQNGVRVTNGAHNNVIGGDQPDFSNTISGNGGNGIQIDDEGDETPRPAGSQPQTVQNRVGRNAIFFNQGRGIAFGIDDFIFNDSQDSDEGPNRQQNYPNLSSYQITPAGEACIQVNVDSNPKNANYGEGGIVVEFFLADIRGQGSRSLGTGDSNWTVADHNTGTDKIICLGQAADLGITATDKITATATDADGNTSEFSPLAVTTAAGVEVSGRVLTSDGRGIGRAVLSLRGPNGVARTVISAKSGRYKFDDVDAGSSYVLTVESRRYRFDPPSLVVNVQDSVTNANFVASGGGRYPE